ncbi:branched-chain amino acid ABC transporter permease [bacterium]|nr:branched-chain amino acid ABC transporter permease [bacterium]
MIDFIKRHPVIITLVLIYIAIEIPYRFEILNSYIVQLIMFVGINIVMTVSLGVINGFTGQFSIGHAGFMAIGAYVSVFFTTIIFQMTGLNEPPRLLGYPLFFIAVGIGGIFAAGAGFLIGLPTLRLKGDYLAIVTMAFGEIIRTIIRVSEPLGGPRGVGGIPEYTNFTIVFGFTVVSIWLMRNFLFSTYGRASQAIRDNEIAAEMMGVDSTRQKVLVFSLSAFFAGCCGGFYAHILQYIHPDNFTFFKSLEYLIYLYIGGASSISGAMSGSFIFTFVPELFRRFQAWRMVIYSMVLVLLMIFRPDGILGDREFPFMHYGRMKAKRQ